MTAVPHAGDSTGGNRRPAPLWYRVERMEDGHVRGPAVAGTVRRVEAEVKPAIPEESLRKLRGKLFRMHVGDDLWIPDSREGNDAFPAPAGAGWRITRIATPRS